MTYPLRGRHRPRRLPGRGHARWSRWHSAGRHNRQASLPPGGEPAVEICSVPQPEPLQDHRRQARLKPLLADHNDHLLRATDRGIPPRGSRIAPPLQYIARQHHRARDQPARPALIIPADVNQHRPPRLRRKSLHGRRAVRQPGPGLGQQIIDGHLNTPPGIMVAAS